MTMMNEYYVEYYTKDWKKVGIRVSAYTSIDARAYAEKMPDFKQMANYPEKV